LTVQSRSVARWTRVTMACTRRHDRNRHPAGSSSFPATPHARPGRRDSECRHRQGRARAGRVHTITDTLRQRRRQGSRLRASNQTRDQPRSATKAQGQYSTGVLPRRGSRRRDSRVRTHRIAWAYSRDQAQVHDQSEADHSRHESGHYEARSQKESQSGLVLPQRGWGKTKAKQVEPEDQKLNAKESVAQPP
jgi:hypothetical protein